MLIAGYVGTAPGTTTMRFGSPPQAWMTRGLPGLPARDLPGLPIQITLPPNQHMTPSGDPIQIQVPPWQSSFGPVPNDADLATTRNYQPVHRGWIETASGNPIVNLQGGLGDSGSIWPIVASVMSAAALATIALIGVLQYRDGKSKRR